MMSVVVIIGILFFVAFKLSQLYLEFETINARLTKLETRMDRLEQKVDLIIEYLLEDRAKRREQ